MPARTLDQPGQGVVLYDEVYTEVCRGSDSLTADKAKDLLGWEEESDLRKFGTDYLFKDVQGKKIRCPANLSNRPLYLSNVLGLKQEILRQRWRFNGEPIIIGRTGLLLNGQHTLVALALAVQEWRLNSDLYDWEEEPTIEKLIVFGVEEDDETVNSLDTCRGRSQADVFYRSEFFAHIPPKERRKVAKTCSYAVNTLWQRLGADIAFAPRQTFAEAVQFLRAHPRVIEATEHICAENGENDIRKALTPGYASGLMYLMGASRSDPKSYIENPCEESLDFRNWEKAEEFFTCLYNDAKEFRSLRTALAQLLEQGASRREKQAMIIKAWLQWANKRKIGRLSLKYEVRDEIRVLSEEPTVGGIDLITFSQEELDD